MSQELKTFNFEITSLDQAMEYAKLISDSDLAPKDYRGKPGNVLIAIQFGAEIGLKPMQAIQNISVINGRPSVWGDAMLAIVQNHPVCEYINERTENDTAYCTVKRRGDEKEYTYEFSKQDAKTAGLTGKAGPWTNYPDRMMQMRARGFALRDKFADVLKGINMREEVQDYVIETTPEVNKTVAAQTITALIEGKGKPTIIFEDVHCMMTDATTMEELDDAASLAKQLSDVDKDKARAMYKTKYLALVKAQTGEINGNELR
jgi:hypothetical protein